MAGGTGFEPVIGISPRKVNSLVPWASRLTTQKLYTNGASVGSLTPPTVMSQELPAGGCPPDFRNPDALNFKWRVVLDSNQ